MLSLLDVRAAHPDLFYAQTWYERQAFAWIVPPPLPPAHDRSPVAVLAGMTPSQGTVHAAQLAALFVRDPGNPLWHRYLWTCDLDDQGQRVYVGGADNSSPPRLEIHRHIHLTDRFGIPLW